MQFRRLRKRQKPFRSTKPIILVVCEGKETEPNYFIALRQTKRINKERLIISYGERGSHPRNVIEDAKDKKKKFEAANLEVNEVWCVFDRDDHKKIEAAFNQARDNHFKIAFSNPCFELWYLLHCQDQTAHIERGKVFSRLKKYIPQYQKSLNVYPDLLVHQSQAINRAKKLRKYHRDNLDSEMKNPSTNVDELVSYLNSLK